jgi:hypothetical protein
MTTTFQGNILLAGTDLNINQTILFLSKNGAADPIITNNGTIHLNGAIGYPSAIGVDTDTLATLTGGGTVEMTLSSLSGYGSLINDAGHTIRGNGTLASVTNKGQLVVENGTMQINNGLTGPGSISVSDNATLRLAGYPIQAGDFFMYRLANLRDVINAIELKGNFSFAQTDPASWTWTQYGSLVMSGAGPQQSLEVGGRDYGLSATGFSNNFSLPSLTLTGAGTYVYLADTIDNGHRASPEALYVDSLSVPAGTTLHLKGLHLYTYLNSSIHQVRAGEGHLFGGGQIIDFNSIPGIINLLLSD